MGKQFFIVDEEGLREKILELLPEIRHDTAQMADLIRESVGLEREKLGLDNPRGTIELLANKEKKNPSAPDFTGSGYVAGRFYRVAAWSKGTDKMRVSLLPQKRKWTKPNGNNTERI